MENTLITMSDLVQAHNNKPVTTSLKVAEVFEKSHRHVLRDIESLEIPEDFNRTNFGLINYTDKQGRTQKAYQMTKDGFTLLAMGYTGEKAMKFKIAYINAFNKMEQALIQNSISKEKKYFDRKSELYKQKHEKEIAIKTINSWFFATEKGKQLQEEEKQLRDIKIEIAKMDRREFGYTHNLFSMIEENIDNQNILNNDKVN
jgi:Rha family phage regulatory protein